MRLGHLVAGVFARVGAGALAVAIGTAVIGTAMVGQAWADPVKIRQGWVVAGADAPLLMYGQPGIAQQEGKSYTLDAIHFSGTPPMITALGAGEIDVAALAYSTFALAVENGGMSNLRILADVFRDGVPGYYSNEYMVLKDSPIKKVEDLKGKVAASNGAGSAVDMAMRAMFKRHGLEDKKNVTIIEVGFPNMRAVLADHKVDLISAVTPFSYDPALRNIARTLFTQKEAIGTSEMIILVAQQSFISKNRAALVDYLEDSLRALHWYSAPANHDKAVDILANFSKVPPSRYASWLFTKGDFYHDPKGLPDLDALQRNIDMQQQLGFLHQKLDVKKYVDLSLVKEAGARIK